MTTAYSVADNIFTKAKNSTSRSFFRAFCIIIVTAFFLSKSLGFCAAVNLIMYKRIMIIVIHQQNMLLFHIQYLILLLFAYITWLFYTQICLISKCPVVTNYCFSNIDIAEILLQLEKNTTQPTNQLYEFKTMARTHHFTRSVWEHNNSLIPTHFITMHVPGQARKVKGHGYVC